MTYLERLLRVELAAQVSLLACVLLFAIILVAVGLLGINQSFEGADPATTAMGTAAVLSMVVYMYCVGPVALLIAPIYAALEGRNRATAVTSTGVGLVPGVLMLIYSATPFAASGSVDSLVPLGCLATGASVAAGVHLIRTWNQP